MDKFSIINGEIPYTGSFVAETNHATLTNESLVLAFLNNEFLLKDNALPTNKQLKKIGCVISKYVAFGKINKTPCFIADIKAPENLPEDYRFLGLRASYSILNQDELRAAIFGQQIDNWNRKTQFCGACGSKTTIGESKDWVKHCPQCGESFFPKISPAIIVAITHNGKLLMAKHNRLQGRYALLAGFVNPGESLEECLHREVFEEAGIKIKNVEYFGSQPWPFPDSLMAGYKAEYESGELIPEQGEIIDLKWFSPEEIEIWTDRSNIARRLLDDFMKNSGK